MPGGAGSDAHDAPGVGASYVEVPDFDGPAGFLAALADARVAGEFRDHAPRYPRRPPAGTDGRRDLTGPGHSPSRVARRSRWQSPSPRNSSLDFARLKYR